jgi:hypothetical protein
VTSDDSLTTTAKRLFQQLFFPVLTNATLDYGQFVAYDTYPTPLPTAFAGEQLIQTGRFQRGGTFPVKLKGTVRNAAYQVQNNVTFSDTNRSLLAVARFWGAQKIQYLLNLIKQVGEMRELVDQVVNLSIRYGVLTPYTAFLVVEPSQGGLISVDDDKGAVRQFELFQNYPNPFNPSTAIRYVIGGEHEVFVKLVIYNVLGEEVKTLVAALEQPGTYHVSWDGTDNQGRRVSSGTYIYRLIAGSYVSAKTMVLVK